MQNLLLKIVEKFLMIFHLENFLMILIILNLTLRNLFIDFQC